MMVWNHTYKNQNKCQQNSINHALSIAYSRLCNTQRKRLCCCCCNTQTNRVQTSSSKI